MKRGIRLTIKTKRSLQDPMWKHLSVVYKIYENDDYRRYFIELSKFENMCITIAVILKRIKNE
jgi:hypothetical protein